MTRVSVALAAVMLLVTLPLAESAASAAPPNSTSITLTCDSGASAAVSITLEGQLANPLSTPDLPDPLTCVGTTGLKRTRLVVMTSAPATAVSVTQYQVALSPSLLSLDCAPAHLSLPAKLTCRPDGANGAQLVVR